MVNLKKIIAVIALYVNRLSNSSKNLRFSDLIKNTKCVYKNWILHMR